MVIFKADVDEKEHLESYEEMLKATEEKREKKLQQHCENSKKRDVEIDSVLTRGISAADAILDHAIKGDYDMIVLSDFTDCAERKIEMRSPLVPAA